MKSDQKNDFTVYFLCKAHQFGCKQTTDKQKNETTYTICDISVVENIRL